MTVNSGYNPDIISDFTKIIDLDNLRAGKNYLVSYIYNNRVRENHIAKFIEVKKEPNRLAWIKRENKVICQYI